MRNGLKVLLVYGIAILLAITVYSATTATTTMTWVVPSAVAHTLSYGGTCSQNNIFFVEDTCTIDADVDGNGSQCLPYEAASGGTVCQSASLAPLTITNTGNVSVDIDANIVGDAFDGADLNLVLKVWMGDGAGCGASGLGGWEFDCTASNEGDTTTAVTASTCRNFNQFNETTGGRLVNTLLVTDTNTLCISGDFNAGPNFTQGGAGGVSQGSHTITNFQTTSVAS
ncbi:MAG: hypothetical protein ABIH20_02425 [Candidatus Diapherotrites archaeon]